MEEIWKDIKDYEGLYQVSNLGRVKSLGNKKRKEKILKPCKVKSGYLRVQLSKRKMFYVRKMFFVHRLVAESFISNPYNLPQVNHLDLNKENNNISNLEWVSPKKNIEYSEATKIKCLDLKTNKVTIYPSIREATRQLEIKDNGGAIYYNIYNSKSPYKNRYIFTEIKE